MVLGESLIVVALGLVVGIPAALACGRLVSSELYDLEANDPLTIAASAAALLAVASAAVYLPARRPRSSILSLLCARSNPNLTCNADVTSAEIKCARRLRNRHRSYAAGSSSGKSPGSRLLVHWWENGLPGE